MEEKIRNLADRLYEDVQITRSSDLEVKERAGIELMSLNAIINAYRALEKKRLDTKMVSHALTVFSDLLFFRVTGIPISKLVGKLKT